ncbi:MAG: hypothetical protein LBE85_09875 [Candidatus Accumulibacter sp.]|nr:hypothetical protein [Accumulibacter sp.]
MPALRHEREAAEFLRGAEAESPEQDGVKKDRSEKKLEKEERMRWFDSNPFHGG